MFQKKIKVNPFIKHWICWLM